MDFDRTRTPLTSTSCGFVVQRDLQTSCVPGLQQIQVIHVVEFGLTYAKFSLENRLVDDVYPSLTSIEKL